MSYDTGDEAQVKERKTKAQLQRERELAELAALMATRGGRAFFARMLSKWMLYDNPVSPDPHRQYFSAGLRQAAVDLRNELREADKTAYRTMEMENE